MSRGALNSGAATRYPPYDLSAAFVKFVWRGAHHGAPPVDTGVEGDREDSRVPSPARQDGWPRTRSWARRGPFDAPLAPCVLTAPRALLRARRLRGRLFLRE
jgi:hypothetical protein